MNILYLTDGRDWAREIISKLLKCKSKAWTISKIITSKEKIFKSYPLDNLGCDYKVIKHTDLLKVYQSGMFKPYDVLLCYGWSWIIPKEIVGDKKCICCHTSPLPKYRGGSPLQHQIINGETKSAVSLFRMIPKLDGGLIYRQQSFSLDGQLRDILKRIERVGFKLTVKMLDAMATGKNKGIVQDESKATVFKRRTHKESEIKELNNLSAKKLYNFIRALGDPYPNAFIKLKDAKLVFKKVEIVKRKICYIGIIEIEN